MMMIADFRTLLCSCHLLPSIAFWGDRQARTGQNWNFWMDSHLLSRYPALAVGSVQLFHTLWTEHFSTGPCPSPTNLIPTFDHTPFVYSPSDERHWNLNLDPQQKIPSAWSDSPWILVSRWTTNVLIHTAVLASFDSTIRQRTWRR